jgi:hypothetical protein
MFTCFFKHFQESSSTFLKVAALSGTFNLSSAGNSSQSGLASKPIRLIRLFLSLLETGGIFHKSAGQSAKTSHVDTSVYGK